MDFYYIIYIIYDQRSQDSSDLIQIDLILFVINMQSPYVGIDIDKTVGTFHFCIAMFIYKKIYIIYYNIYNLIEFVGQNNKINLKNLKI